MNAVEEKLLEQGHVVEETDIERIVRCRSCRLKYDLDGGLNIGVCGDKNTDKHNTDEEWARDRYKALAKAAQSLGHRVPSKPEQAGHIFFGRCEYCDKIVKADATHYWYDEAPKEMCPGPPPECSDGKAVDEEHPAIGFSRTYDAATRRLGEDQEVCKEPVGYRDCTRPKGHKGRCIAHDSFDGKILEKGFDADPAMGKNDEHPARGAIPEYDMEHYRKGEVQDLCGKHVSAGLICTRPKGHEGKCIAHGGSGKVIGYGPDYYTAPPNEDDVSSKGLIHGMKYWGHEPGEINSDPDEGYFETECEKCGAYGAVSDSDGFEGAAYGNPACTRGFKVTRIIRESCFVEVVYDPDDDTTWTDRAIKEADEYGDWGTRNHGGGVTYDKVLC